MAQTTEDFGSKVQHLQKTLDGIPNDHPDRAGHLVSLGVIYIERYRDTRAAGDPTTAVKYFEQALTLTAKHDSARSDRLQILGDAYMIKWFESRSLEDIEFSILQFQEALDLTSKEDSRFANRLETLGNTYSLKHKETGDSRDSDRAIEMYQEALNYAAHDYPDRARRFENLGKVYTDRYSLTQTPTDIQLAIHQYQQALDLTPSECHAERADRFENLGSSYAKMYRRYESLDDLGTTVNMLREAFDCTPEDSSKQEFRHFSLGEGYVHRYSRTGALEDLQQAIQHHEESLRRIPLEYPYRAGRLVILGDVYKLRYIRSGAIEDIELAMEQYREALNLTPDDHPNRADRFEALANGYKDRHHRTGAIEDLEVSIQVYQQCIALTKCDPPKKARRLRGLGRAYEDRYSLTEALVNLELAKRQYEGALALTACNHPDRAYQLEYLGDVCCRIHERTKDWNTLKFALKCYQDALDLTPHDHPDRAARYLSLGDGYQHQYIQTGSLADIQNAIQNFEQAIHLTPQDHAKRAYRIGRLGDAYDSMYTQTKSFQNLEKSIELYRQALDLTPFDDTVRGGRLHVLAIAYLKSYVRTGNSDIIELSIDRFQEALDFVLQDESDRSYRLYSLADAYIYRYRSTKVPGDLAKATGLYNEGLRYLPASPKHRLYCGRKLSALYAEAKDWLSAYEVVNLTIPLIALLAPQSLELSDRQNLVNEIVGLASDAAAITIKAEKSAYNALELLENGRSIIGSAMNDARMDLSQLRHSHPQVAQRFDTLRNILDNPKSPAEDHDRHDVGRELEKLVLEIRNLVGFSRFLLAPSEEELKSIALDGPVVLVNVSKYGCHAFIIEKERLQALELTDTSAVDIHDKASLLGCSNTELLEWLWDTIANPILSLLGFTEVPGASWPRIWWIPTGILTKFPLHAAGYHIADQNYDTVMDRVISSYSSSIKALDYSRRNISMSPKLLEQKPMVVVGMANTPGYTALPFAQQEVDALTGAAKSMNMQLRQPTACRDAVLSAIADCEIFHFAGHGYTDPADPSKSALVLSDGKLTVESIFGTNLHQHKPLLAYLSACGTGRIKHDELVDEALHIIGACQLAGFQHVIGTLWEVDDESCVNIARTVYQWIQQRASSDAPVSEGLHYAIREARERWNKENAMKSAISREKNKKTNDYKSTTEIRDIEPIEDIPLYWVPYVHYGT